ncbi:Acyl-lipid (9-3)-desaturase-like protein, partial [Drosera capensis]
MVDTTKTYISSDELKTHNKKGDLWISIQGKIYDVSTWIESHPGGEDPLVILAGQDVTDAFVALHPGSAWKELDKFFTGYHLKDYKVSPVSKEYRNLAAQFAKMGLFERKGHGEDEFRWGFEVLGELSALDVLSGHVPNRGIELFCVLVFWIWYPLLVSRLPNWGERFAFVVASFVITGIQHIQFTLNHFSTSVYVGKPSGNDWFEKQTNGSLDISCPSWMDWFHGGLQFQVEHHLFPRLPRNQLRKISPFVKQLCATHNLPYNCASFWKANAMTIDTLRAAALQARDLTNPIPKNLVEAHGLMCGHLYCAKEVEVRPVFSH